MDKDLKNRNNSEQVRDNFYDGIVSLQKTKQNTDVNFASRSQKNDIAIRISITYRLPVNQNANAFQIRFNFVWKLSKVGNTNLLVT